MEESGPKKMRVAEMIDEYCLKVEKEGERLRSIMEQTVKSIQEAFDLSRLIRKEPP